jgi:hypothetical protein
MHTAGIDTASAPRGELTAGETMTVSIHSTECIFVSVPD